ncbi:MAG: ATP-binding protein [Planctomycetota bacterium]
MLGSRLARRIVLPVLVLIGLLFGLLGLAALEIADARVTGELEDTADRVAATLDGMPPEHRPAILVPLAKLVGAEIEVDGEATDPDWRDREYRILERRSRRGPERYRVLFAEERITQRRRDVLMPVAVAGAIGLLVSVLLGLVVAGTIARPIQRLAEQARRFAAGSYDGDVGRRGPGEVGELQESFSTMAEAILESEEKLRESERFAVLGRLAGGIAHELRNPLTAIRMAVDTAATDDPEERAEARKVAVSEIERLDRTLREMLDYVQPRKPVLVHVSVAELFDHVVVLLGPQCEHLKVRLEAFAEPELQVEVDADRIKQALLNLVLNAAQAQPEGGVVRLRASEGRIEVQDEGPGIPPEVRESLLQPFVTTKEAGIGLGLAVVKQVADEHGAMLSFETGPEGTTFTLQLG